MKQLIPLAKARRYAEQIAERLQPFCKRLEIAGSIRRQRAFCGDIDLVAEPLDEPALRARILENKEVVQNGPQNIHVRLANGLELQVFLAQPETRDLLDTKPSNWGTILLCRTGSKEHNIFIAQTARANCCEWKTYQGIWSPSSPSPRGEGRGEGRIIASATEEEIFAALHLKYVKPENREVENRNPVPITFPGSFKS